MSKLRFNELVELTIACKQSIGLTIVSDGESQNDFSADNRAAASQ